MRRALRSHLRPLITLWLFAAIGLLCAGYVLVKQRAPMPLRDTYQLRLELSAADGVAPGTGQPVRVAGVRVGSITGLAIARGNALATVEIERDQLPHVYADARARLEPVTPLKDMQLTLDPGGPPARPLRDGTTIGVERTASPRSLSDLYSQLDADTGAFLQSLVASLEQGTRGRGDDLRRALATLAPTSGQLRAITTALERRRRNIARLTSNLASVARAGSRDGRLATVVAAGNRTLRALGDEAPALRSALAQLPGTLRATRRTLARAQPLARELRTSVPALTPIARRLPHTLDTLRPLARRTRSALARDIRPLVREARPILRTLDPATRDLTALAPPLTSSVQVLNYFANVLNHNPPGSDEGHLFWGLWGLHNGNSALSLGDAHGPTIRTHMLFNCSTVESLLGVGDLAKLLTGTATFCPASGEGGER